MNLRILPFASILIVLIGIRFSFLQMQQKHETPQPVVACETTSFNGFEDFISGTSFSHEVFASTPLQTTPLKKQNTSGPQILKAQVNLPQLIAQNKNEERQLKHSQQQMRRFIDKLPTLADNTKIKTFFANKEKNEIKQSIEELIEHAQQYKGTPYVWGGTSTHGFDCSGFTRYAYQFIGIELPHSSHNQSKLGKIVPLADAQPGDMVFFGKKSGSTYKTNHTGIVVENNGGKIRVIHSSRRGVVVDNIMSIQSYNHKFLFVKRIL